MEKEIRSFGSMADADDADVAYYASLTPEERLELLLELIARYSEAQGEAAKGFARVHRVIELGES
jgi:hypothetical protein